MMHRKSRWISFSLAVLAIVVLAACSPESLEQEIEAVKEENDESREIIFWNIGTEEVDKSIYDQAVERFNSTTDSGYRIKSIAIPNDTYKEKLVIAMSSGECPDMYVSWSGGPMNEYIENGFAKDITSLYQASTLPDKLMEGAVSQATYKERVYAVPFMDVSISGFYYNKELFEKYHVTVPTTISELEQVCEIFRSHGIIPLALANESKWPGSMYFMNLAARYGGIEPFQEAVEGTGTFEDSCFVRAGKKIQDWVKRGYFTEGSNSLSEDDGQARQLLYQEKAAMSLAGSWYTTIMYQDSKVFSDKMGWFQFPKMDGENVDSSILIGSVGCNFISFNCTGDKLKAAFECASMYARDDVIDFLVDWGKIPPFKGVERKITNKITRTIMQSVEKASAIQLWYDQYLPPQVASVHLDTCQELFGLTMSPEEAAAKLQQAMEEYHDHIIKE